MTNNNQLPAIRELTPSELSDTSGAAISTMIMAVKLVAALERINYRFLGCSSENGFTTCTATFDGDLPI